MASQSSPRRTFAFARAFAGATALALLGAGAGCDLDCLDLGCDRMGLEISATRADGEALADGTYEIWLATEDEVFESRCALSELAAGECRFVGDSLLEQSELDLSVAGDDMPRDIRISWSRAVDMGPAIDLTGPRDVAVQIELDGQVLVATQLAPTYERAETAAQQCGACEHAKVTVELDAPI